MLNLKERSLAALNAKTAALFLGLAGLSMLIPFFFHVQWLSGPMVNAILVIALFMIGLRSALLLCFIPSLMALAGGFLPAIMAPILPFIMLSNMIYVFSLNSLHSRLKDEFKGFFAGIITGSFLKFLFLFLSVRIAGQYLVKGQIMEKVLQMFSWTQFFSALTGGLIAYAFLKWLKRL